MRNFLLPVDGSDHSFQAALYLIDLAKTLKDPIQVQVLNVQPDPIPWRMPGVDSEAIGLEPAAWPLGGAETDAVREHLSAHAHVVMSSAVEALGQAGIAHQSHARLGDPVGMIIAACDELGCDTIIMGTRGLGALSGLALGSVTRKVLHLAKVPVVCVKSPQQRETRAT